MGIATKEEQLQVEGLLSAYPEVAAELASIELGMEQFAFTNAIAPADHIKSDIIDKIGSVNGSDKSLGASQSQRSKVYAMSPIWQRAAAAAIILLVGSMVLNIVYYNKYHKAQLAYEQKKEQLIAQNEKMQALNKDMSIVQNKYSLPVALNGLPAAPEAEAKIFWMKNTGEVYIDPSNLPKAPEGKQYQLWAIVDGKPVDGGLIVTAKNGNSYHIQKMKTFGKAQAFAVTLETTGGNETPKGDMYVMGKM